MNTLQAKKDGLGNIVISEDSFEMLLACLDNQKFVGEAPQNGDSIAEGSAKYFKSQKDIQDVIDYYNRECRKILHQKYVLSTVEDEYLLCKRYSEQNGIIPWSSEDVSKVKELFKDKTFTREVPKDLLPLDGTESIMEGTEPIGKTKDGWIVCKPQPKPWMIERPLRYDNNYLTISENGISNRPWTQEDVEMIQNKLNN